MDTQVKLTSLNLWGRVKWSEREPLIVEYLREVDADIVFFQEVVYLPEESAETQPTELNELLQYEHRHSIVSRLQTSPLYENYREGLCILSKYPVVQSETLVLKQNPNDHLQRIVQLFDVNQDGKVVKYANVHFAEKPEMAYEHLEELLHILRSRNEQRIIVGDFNVPDLEQHIALWQEEYVASTKERYVSYPANEFRIDYVLVPKANEIISVVVSPDGLSDHRALTVEIGLNK